ncbi:S-adenosyl-L-methionine-dependent methyltransferase [Xylaria arbuscula]|nr:S-adenosyl-L-methionine-dependent methyltransferase [Xylaria arbuscula]
MSSPPEYVMTRDYIDNNRINLQHYLSREIFGYLTHPTIPTTASGLRVADIGTGTGIWLSDLASRVPKDAKLDGLDVSFDAVPPKALLPSNVSLYNWNIKEAVPKELAGVYDVVHVRHFSFVLQDHEIEQVLTNLYELLKPGGYLQWTEPDVASFRVEKGDSGDESDVMIQLIKASQTQDKRLIPTWVPKMPAQFKACGLSDIVADVREASGDIGLAMHECNLTLHEIIARQTQNKEVAQRISDLMPKVCRATRNGAYIAFTRWTVVGKKAIVS